MIHDASTLDLPLTIQADLCVVGSGAGGMTAATIAAEAGLDVIVLEAGAFVPPESMTQREEEMLPQLLWAGGGRTSADKGVRIHQGRALGGSTVHNINLCSRIPIPLRQEWARKHTLASLPQERWDALYREVETMLRVSAVPPAQWNRHNTILQEGCERLGWAGGGLRHNRTGCLGSGFCLLGCAYDAKNNAPRILLPRLIAAGGQVLTRTQAVVVEHRGGEVTGVRAAALDPHTSRALGTVKIQARRVCLSASATGTPAILLRSHVPDPSDTTGRSLRVHPALVAAGDFDEPVQAWRGIPQTYECTELLDFARAHPPSPTGPAPRGTRTWIVPAFAHPVGTATMMPGLGRDHRELMGRYEHLAVLTAMVHDQTAGRVRPRGDFGVRIDYVLDAEDRAELAAGAAACARLLAAAGATRVLVPTNPIAVLSPSAGDAALEADLAAVEAFDPVPGSVDVTAVHPMGSVPMDDDPERAAVGSDGRHHHLAGLWIADGSLFPTSIGVPPQLSIYAMGLHVGRALSAAPS